MPNGGEQLLAANMHLRRRPITQTMGRAMGDQYVHALRYAVPMLPTIFAALQVECPVAKLGLPRRTIDPVAAHFCFGVLQICAAGEGSPSLRAVEGAIGVKS